MHKICFTISLVHASTCFEHHVLIVRRSKLYYTASGIITPVGGRNVHRLREDALVYLLCLFCITNFDVLLTVHLNIFIS